MDERFKHCCLAPSGESFPFSGFGVEIAERTLCFHQSFPEYSETPLVSLSALAVELGLGALYVKDESFRFGLNAFKVLGSSWAIAGCIAKRLGLAPGELGFERLTSDKLRAKTGRLTFVTATDGNHGRGVAWTAARLGHRSVVYMPKGTVPERLANIRALGAEAEILDLNYDDCVRLAASRAADNGWITVQDTSWPGYDEIPRLVMQGYCTMALEAYRQLRGLTPTHILLQAGVGSMAAAVAGFFADACGAARPRVIIVEPNAADCFYLSAAAGDGLPRAVTGDMRTIMAGLACGEPCPVAWELLRSLGADYISMPDYVAAGGMRILGAPLPGDRRVISGESGASAFGLVAELCLNKSLTTLRKSLGLSDRARVLCISTEGDTDRDNYRRVVWGGRFPRE